MKQVLNFLSDLYDNNNKLWFDAHKKEYQQANEKCNVIAEELIHGISKFDSSISGISIKDCTYRIYRDVRFSPDKTPYKTHIGIYVCRGGKKSNFAGYYFHIQPKGNNFLEGNLLSAGLYLAEPKIIKSVREEIDYNGEIFLENIKKADGFQFETYNKLKKMPKGFDENSKFAEYIKQKDFLLGKAISNNYLLQPNLAEKVVKEFKKTYNFISQLNKAVEFVLEDN
ncbi:MAG: DUF2461 domain-containing protein [Bacteroidales bacterium]|jgi:uncharacterized protein (TIGR02453 family)|nr:DUF2461 domain-containing protein [Bacteroidales bacterium]